MNKGELMLDDIFASIKNVPMSMPVVCGKTQEYLIEAPDWDFIRLSEVLSNTMDNYSDQIDATYVAVHQLYSNILNSNKRTQAKSQLESDANNVVNIENVPSLEVLQPVETQPKNQVDIFKLSMLPRPERKSAAIDIYNQEYSEEFSDSLYPFEEESLKKSANLIKRERKMRIFIYNMQGVAIYNSEDFGLSGIVCNKRVPRDDFCDPCTHTLEWREVYPALEIAVDDDHNHPIGIDSDTDHSVFGSPGGVQNNPYERNNSELPSPIKFNDSHFEGDDRAELLRRLVFNLKEAHVKEIDYESIKKQCYNVNFTCDLIWDKVMSESCPGMYENGIRKTAISNLTSVHASNVHLESGEGMSSGPVDGAISAEVDVVPSVEDTPVQARARPISRKRNDNVTRIRRREYVLYEKLNKWSKCESKAKWNAGKKFLVNVRNAMKERDRVKPKAKRMKYTEALDDKYRDEETALTPFMGFPDPKDDDFESRSNLIPTESVNLPNMMDCDDGRECTFPNSNEIMMAEDDVGQVIMNGEEDNESLDPSVFDSSTEDSINVWYEKMQPVIQKASTTKPVDMNQYHEKVMKIIKKKCGKEGKRPLNFMCIAKKKPENIAEYFFSILCMNNARNLKITHKKDDHPEINDVVIELLNTDLHHETLERFANPIPQEDENKEEGGDNDRDD